MVSKGARQGARQRTKKVAVALPPMETAPENWLRNIRLSGFALTILALIVLSIVILAPGLRTLVDQQQQIAALTASNAAKTTDVKNLQGEVARWSDPAYIEAQARERIYYVKPGELTYLVIGQDTTKETPVTANGAPISTTIQTTQVNWMQSIMSSLATAGLTDATPSQLDSTTK